MVDVLTPLCYCFDAFCVLVSPLVAFGAWLVVGDMVRSRRRRGASR